MTKTVNNSETSTFFCKPNSDKVGTLSEVWIKSEYNHLQTLQTNTLFTKEQRLRKCTKCFQLMNSLDCTLLLWSNAVVIDAVWTFDWDLPWKEIIWMSTYVVLKPVHTFECWWCLSRCAGCQILCHPSCRLLNWALMFPLLLSSQDTAFIVIKKNFHRTDFHCTPVHFNWASAQTIWMMFTYHFS